MRISALRLFNVRRFAGRGVAIEGIGSGVNVLCAANEFGKSTSFEALHALFFQPHSGTPGEVQRLRPYGGGSPIVEVDIATEAGRFRVAKQYYSGRAARVTDLDSGRIVAQSDEAEAFIAGLIRGGAAGPAGLLWVRQGITSLEKRSRTEDENEKQVRASLLESVQGEVEAVTGGRRMAEIMLAVRDELSLLVTATGKPKVGGRYLAAIEECDRLAADHERLEHEVSTLRAALDKRSAAMKRLAEREDPEERRERAAAIASAEAACEAARARSAQLKTADAELGLARDRREAGERELRAFTAAMERASELATRLGEVERRRADAVSRREAAAASLAAASAGEEAAEAEERAARTLLDRLDAALAAAAASDRLTGLTERLRDAESIRKAIEDGEARFALLKLPGNAIDRLQALEVEIAERRAVEQAGRPSVAITYEAASPAPVSMDGTPLASGEQRSYASDATLSVPGVGTIVLRSNRPIQTDGSLERAEENRRTLLTSLGVEGLAAARDREARAREAEAELREQRGRLSVQAPEGLQKLREEIAACGSVDAEALELKENPAEVRKSLAEAQELRKSARQKLRETEPQRTAAEEAFVAAETALAALRTERNQLEASLGPESERDERAQGLTRTLDDLQRRFEAAHAQAQGLREAAVDLEAAEGRLRRARTVETAAEKEVNELRETIAGLNGEIRMRADEAIEETWRENAEALAAAQQRVRAFEQEVAILRRLSSALESARVEARELYLKPVMSELKPLLGLLFDDASITFDDKTLLPHTIRRNGQEEEVDRLSGGMREQLSVLTRLAFARLLARDGRPAPVILDDALVYSDDDRIEKMFDVLHRQSRDQQIIVFSCRQRAFQRLGGNVLRMTDWEPKI